MLTSKEREHDFRKDLKKLLEKHKATLYIGDDGKPYGMHNGVVTISMTSEWDDTGNQLAEYTEFYL